LYGNIEIPSNVLQHGQKKFFGMSVIRDCASIDSKLSPC
jgi:hypothetical protein